MVGRGRRIARQSWFRALLIAWGMVVAGGGCFSSAPPGTVTVTGTVTFEGSRVPGGQVDFESVEPGLCSSSARIGSDGTFTTPLKPGSYFVRVGGQFKRGTQTDSGVGRPSAPPNRRQVDVDAKHRTVSIEASE